MKSIFTYSCLIVLNLYIPVCWLSLKSLQERKGNHSPPPTTKYQFSKPVLYVRFHEDHTNFGIWVWNNCLIIIINKNRECYLQCLNNYILYRQATRLLLFCYGRITVNMEEIQRVCSLTSGLRFSSLLFEVLYVNQTAFIYLFSISRKTKFLCLKQRSQATKQHSDLSLF